MEIEYNYEYGTLRDCERSVKQKLNGYMRYYREIYVGATSNVDARARQHQQRGFQKMVVLFGCDHPGSAESMERKLIEHAAESNFRIELWNQTPGGEGLVEGAGPYWVYILVA